MIMSKGKRTLISLLVLLFVTLPTFASAAGLVYVCPGAKPGECTFQDLINATKNVVNQLTVLAIGFSVVVIVYAGFIYMTSAGNPGKISQATGMLTKVVIGIGFIIGAWAIVNLLAKALGVTAFSFSVK